VGALGQMGGSDVVDKLLELLAHDSVNIRRMAVEALGRTGEPRVVQSLITRLDETKEDEPEVRQSIAEALGRLGNSAAIQRSPAALMEILRGEDNSPMSRMVMETLERTGTAEMCKTLLDNLEREGDTRKRRAIVHALGRLGDVRAIPPLSRAISSSRALQTDATDAKDDVRQSAAEALARLGESAAVDPLIEVLSKEKGRARLHVVSALGRLGHAKALKPLQDILQQGADRQDPVYLGALIALSQLGDISALDHLTIWLRLGDSLMRRGSLETLVGSSTARWIESRIFAQSGEEGYIRQAAVEALGRFDSLRPIDLLITRLSDGNIFVRRGAARALGRLGSRDIRVVEPLIARLNDGDSGVRQYAAEALGQLRDRRAVTPLIALLQDATSDVRRYAAEALGRLGDGRALQPLLSQLQGEKGKRQDGVEDVRRAALLAYAKIGLQSQQELAASKVRAVFNAAEHDRVKLVAAVALLALRPTDPPEAEIQAWLENYAGSVQTNRRKELADLLGEFPTAVGTRLLFRLLETENRREDRNLSVQVSALTALGLSQAQAALPELYTQLKNPNFRLQEAAAEALADIASAESIDPLTAITSTIGPAVSIPTRLAGLKALYNIAKNSKATDASWQKAIKGMLDAVQSRDGEAILGIRTYNLLGDLQAHGEPLDYLQKRLDQEAAQQSTWRSKRDAWEHKDATEEQTRPGQSELEKAQSRPHLAFELAYNIARIDPAGAGLRLLSHDLADIRRGAWLGLGTVGNVELLEKLHQARQHSHDPLFRHAAYQAIDHILLSLEAEEFKPQELLQQLEVLAPTLCKPVNASAEKGICLRVEWTMTQLRAKGAIHEQHSAEYSANQNQ
jgi:HEAT repeat protein